MPPLPRGTCSVCGSDVALRVGGKVREHRQPTNVAPASGFVRARGGVCPGSGKPAKAAA